MTVNEGSGDENVREDFAAFRDGRDANEKVAAGRERLIARFAD